MSGADLRLTACLERSKAVFPSELLACEHLQTSDLFLDYWSFSKFLVFDQQDARDDHHSQQYNSLPSQSWTRCQE